MNTKKAILEYSSQPFAPQIAPILKPQSFPAGEVFPDLGLAPGEKVYGMYREKYYLTTTTLCQSK